MKYPKKYIIEKIEFWNNELSKLTVLKAKLKELIDEYGVESVREILTSFNEYRKEVKQIFNPDQTSLSQDDINN